MLITLLGTGWTLFRRVLSQKESVWFKRPVDPVRDGCGTYFQFIKKPMDMGTVKQKLTGKQHLKYSYVSTPGAACAIVLLTPPHPDGPGFALPPSADSYISDSREGAA